ncbi:MAG: guanylate kinase [Candidatus Komeilibacteria bacterium RIFCSPLOWO2_01_FULL_45_10]|uniref:Guanylate kinase n=1 Tax=Candidatus Komeilibacteria bacterium RIFCSPLOWO2_01_FULL_45_10 TaxID=1798550 RepID=A0A1G2BLB4_9BACT|nr:MAG: guanylate kinase [Candidatus Komeilibacteria bacterium RIFCSPLOWO2_01_FULL_45_10]
MKKNKLFILTGTSAVGKTSVALGVLKKSSAKGGSASGEKNIQRSLTFTSRPQRKGEKNGVDYHFIALKNFKNKIKKGEFLEWADNYGHYYGTNKEEIGKILKSGKNALVVIDIKGALNIKKKWPQSVTIFILPESVSQLKKRFQKRADTSPKDIAKRLKIAHWELAQASKCDYWVVNRENRLGEAINAVLAIVG